MGRPALRTDSRRGTRGRPGVSRALAQSRRLRFRFDSIALRGSILHGSAEKPEDGQAVLRNGGSVLPPLTPFGENRSAFFKKISMFFLKNVLFTPLNRISVNNLINDIRVSDGSKSVRDDEHRLAVFQAFYGFHHRLLRFVIQR